MPKKKARKRAELAKVPAYSGYHPFQTAGGEPRPCPAFFSDCAASPATFARASAQEVQMPFLLMMIRRDHKGGALAKLSYATFAATGFEPAASPVSML